MKKITLLVLSLLLGIFAIAQVTQKPVIGISSTWGEGTSASVPVTYIESVIKAGGVPMVLPISHDPAILECMLERIDGLIMTGGEDIDPLKWFGEEPIPALGRVVPERDSFDIALIRLAVEKKIPVLGICRGHQLMNVAFGGTLYQDIPSQVKGSNIKHRQSAPSNYGTHTINILEGSVLHKQTGKTTLVVNSFHHQAVKDIAPGFIATAHSLDGVIEAIEKKGSDRVFGVQFHPEGFTSTNNEVFLGVFKDLVKKSRAYRESKH